LAYKRYAKIYRRREVTAQQFPMKVACITDLDIWPDKAEMRAGNPIGFKVKKLPDAAKGKTGNLNRWVNYYDDKPDELVTRMSNKCEQDGENVKTFISEEWTFEYCLAKSGLAREIYQSIKGSIEGFDKFKSDEEEKAIQIYAMIDKKSSGKTEATYKLAQILEGQYADRPEALKDNLPPYIVSAIEYVTEDFSIPLVEDSTEAELETEGV